MPLGNPGVEPTPMQVPEIRAVQLKILDRVLAWCAERGIRCYATYGTLLGARRHEGYIPWDDDIDIMMPRADYECLRSVVSVSGLIVGGHEHDEGWPYSNIKVSDPTTLVTGDGPFEAGAGVNIDVFPVDFPLGGLAGGLQAGSIRAIVSLLALQALMPRAGRGARARLAAATLQPASRIVPRHFLLRSLDAIASAGKEGPRAGVLVGSYQWAVQTDSLVEGSVMKFEERDIPVPSDSGAVLTAMYGPEYMTPPPDTERTSHHSFSAYRLYDEPPEAPQ